MEALNIGLFMRLKTHWIMVSAHMKQFVPLFNGLFLWENRTVKDKWKIHASNSNLMEDFWMITNEETPNPNFNFISLF